MSHVTYISHPLFCAPTGPLPFSSWSFERPTRSCWSSASRIWIEPVCLVYGPMTRSRPVM